MAGMESVNKEYFDQVYENKEDPWHYESSEYEKEKYDASLRALPKERYQNALEIGCSIGVFTAELASRCDRLLAVDIAAAAVDKARERCAGLDHVTVEVMSIPEEYPGGLFDLIVLSEVGYYLGPERLTDLSNRITNQAVSGGHLLLVHWLLPVPNYQLRGDDVHLHFLGLPAWHSISSSRADRYRIDVLERRDRAGDPL